MVVNDDITRNNHNTLNNLIGKKRPRHLLYYIILSFKQRFLTLKLDRANSVTANEI